MNRSARIAAVTAVLSLCASVGGRAAGAQDAPLERGRYLVEVPPSAASATPPRVRTAGCGRT